MFKLGRIEQLEQDLKLKEIKSRIINQHSVVYCFKCDLCDSHYVGYATRHLFQRIADHRYSAIGRHLRDAHGKIDLLNESQFRTCLLYTSPSPRDGLLSRMPSSA